VIQLVLHHVRKDLRAVRPWLLLWLALLVANVVCLVPAVDLAFRWADPRSEQFIWWTYMLSAARVLLGMVLTVRVIGADEPSGTTAFWLTRPLPSGALLSAKLLVIIGLIGVGALVNVAGLLLNSMEAGMIPGALGEIALFESLPLLPLAVVASLTHDTARLVLAGLACLVLYGAGRLTAVKVTAYGHDARIGVGVLFLGLILFASSLSCLIVQYLARQARRTLGLAGAGLALVAVVGFVAPFRPEPPGVTRPWRQAASVSARLTPYAVAKGTIPAEAVRASPKIAAATPLYRRIYADLNVQGLPPGVVVRPQSVDGTLRFPDGHEARFRQELSWRTYTITGQSALDPQVTAAAAHAVKATVFHAEDNWNRFMRIPVMATDTPDVRQRWDMPGRYDGTVKLLAYRLRLAAVLPRKAGASAGFRSRHLAIARGPESNGPGVNEGGGSSAPAGRTEGEPEVEVMQARLTAPALAWQPRGGVEFVLVNRSRGEALPGHYRQRFGRPEQLSALYLWAPIADLAFPYRVGKRRLDDDWFRGAELAILTIEEEGSFSVKVAMDEVTVR